jgi:sugar diacid utilization regulator
MLVRDSGWRPLMALTEESSSAQGGVPGTTRFGEAAAGGAVPGLVGAGILSVHLRARPVASARTDGLPAPPPGAGGSAASSRSAVSVGDCLRLPALRGSEVVAGRGGLDAPVRRVSTASQTQGCVPGELRLLGRLLTAEAVHDAHEGGVSALAAAIVSVEATEAAEAVGTPLIRLASHVDLAAIATDLTGFIVATLEESLCGLGEVTARLAAAGASDLRLESMSEALAGAIGAPVLVEDAGLRVLCVAGGGVVDRGRLEAIRARSGAEDERAGAALREFYRVLADAGRPVWLLPDSSNGLLVPRLTAPIVAVGELLGYCSAFFPDGAPDERVVTVALEQAANLLGLALLHERIIGTSRRAACASMLVDLLDGRMSMQLLRTRASQLGIDLGGSIAVALFRGLPEQRPEDWLRHALTTLNGQRRTLVDVVGGVVVAPLAGDDRERALRWLRGLCVACGGGVAVLGRGSDVDGVPGAYSETRRVIDLLARSAAATQGAVVDVDDLGLLGVLIDSSATGALERFWQRRLAPLLEYDAREHSDLCGSLRAFFDEGGLRRAARRMNLHPNSFNYRLRRAEQIGGFSLADPEARLELQLALRCQRLLGP